MRGMKKGRKLLCGGLAMAVICAVLFADLPVYADELEDGIRQKQEQIDQAEKEKEALQSDLGEVQKRLQELKATATDLNEYIEELDVELTGVGAKVQELRKLINAKEAQIQETSQELAQAQAREDSQYEAMKKRLQFMYENQDTFYLDMLFSSHSFGDLLNRAEYIESISAYDKKMLDEFMENRQLIETFKAQLEKEQAELTAQKETVEAEEEKLELLLADKQEEVESYESDISNKEQIAQDYEAQIAEQNEVIMALERAVLEEKKRQAEEAGTGITYDGGVFKWPAPSYTQITSDYGNRMHPTLGVERFHNGIDMAAPNGSPILAAYDGKVVAADYNGSMGNYAMIDHGGGLYTIYMHASAIYVSKGELVARGQNIGAVGSTGRSTGPHLHFSVRKDGAYETPWNYLQ